MWLNKDELENLRQWIEQVFALRGLDHALLLLSSVVNIIFAIGNTVYGMEVLSFILPLYFIAWVMPIWSGYFLGAIFRRNLIDRIRGWMYLLSGTASYLISPVALIWVPLPLGIHQVDPLIFPKSILLLILYNAAFAAISWNISEKIACKLFRTVAQDDVIQSVTISNKPFLLTYIAVISFSSMSSLYIWDNLRSLLEPDVFPVDSYLYAAIIFAAFGLFFEYLATKSTNVKTAGIRKRRSIW